MDRRTRQAKKDAALLGSKIAWVDNWGCCDDEEGNMHFEPVVEVGTIVRATPRYIWVEYEYLGQKRRRSLGKVGLLSGTPDNGDHDYIPAKFVNMRKRIEESLPEEKGQRQTTEHFPEQQTPYVAYILTDDTETVYYVGISKNVKRRYAQHCKCAGLNLKLNLWIQGLLEQGQLPKITIVGTAHDQEEAEELEAQLIAHYLKQGAPLKNIAKRVEVQQ